MRLTIFLFLTGMVSVLAGTVYSQTTALQFDLKNVSLEKALLEIEKQTNYYFLYNNQLIDVDKRVNMKAENEPVEVVLDRVLEGLDIGYEIKSRQIVLSAKQGVAQQESIKVSGKVTDQNGLSLPGVSISIEGTGRGVISNQDGAYQIEVQAQETLVFSFIGFRTQNVKVAGRTLINVVLEEKLESIDEVMVVAYGVSTREASTGSVGMVSNDDLQKNVVTSPEKALQGRIAGVQINNYSGQPGGGTDIYIRGISSLNSGNAPLYVVDGVPVISGYYGYSTVNSNIMSSLDASDIESMTVLKDAAAASVYGSRAANGVVLITTKSGKAGKTKIELNSKYGLSTLAKSGDYRYMTPEELLGYHRQAVVNAGFDPDNSQNPQYYYPMSLLDQPQTDWFKEVFRTGNIRNIDLSASGGTDKTLFYLSGSYYGEEGIMIGSDMERFNLTSNIDHKVNDRISLGIKTKASYSKVSDLPQQLYWSSPIYAAQNLLPWESPYNEDGTINWDLPSNWNYNPIGIAQENDQWDRFYRLMNSVYLEWELAKGLKFRTNNSVDYVDNEGRNYKSPDMPDGEDVDGEVWAGLTKNINLQTSNTLEYTTQFNDSHNLRVLAGHEIQYNKYSQYDLNTQGVGTLIPYISNSTKDKKDIDYSITENALVSLFGIVNYNYKDRYLFTASIRGDGSSRFSPDYRWGLFYSGGASWNLHNESFLKNNSDVNLLKIRASYGTNGNYNIGNYRFFGTYVTSEYNNNSSSLPNRLQNDNLTWEKNKELNIGIDAVLFKRLTANLEVYNRITSDMLLSVQLPTTTGFSSQLRNTGKLRNRGIEFSLNYDVVKNSQIKFNVGFNVAHNETKLLDLGGEDEILDGWNRIHRLNESFSQWYVFDWAGVNPLTGMGMWYNSDGELTEKYSNARRVAKGQIEPKYVGGFTFDLSWKGFTLSSLFEFKTGHSVYIMESTYTKSDGWYIGHNQVASQLDYWKEPGDMVAIPKPIANNSSNSNAWKIGRWIEKGDYLRFKNINLTYNIPARILKPLKLNSCAVYVEGSNLYAWHDVSYWDPERSYNGDTYSTYPMSRQVIFGIKLGF